MAKAAKKTTTTTEPAQAARVFGYVRVSTTQQADEGESLQVQRRQITGYAQMQGLKIEKVFVERGISGSKPLDDRPQGSALIGTLRPGDTVITAKLDRMFRSASNALEIMGAMKKAGISLHMLDLGGDVTGNGVSKLVFTILAAVAEAERDRIRERITEAKRDQRAQGRYFGGKPPFGWTVGADGELVGIPAQQAAIKRILRLREARKSYREIAEKLTAEGCPVSHVGIRSVLRRAAA